MNLDFSQYPELDGPIVLLIGCPSGIPRKLHLLDDVVIEANAQTVEIIDIQLEEDALWWVSPWQEDRCSTSSGAIPARATTPS